MLGKSGWKDNTVNHNSHIDSGRAMNQRWGENDGEDWNMGPLNDFSFNPHNDFSFFWPPIMLNARTGVENATVTLGRSPY